MYIVYFSMTGSISIKDWNYRSSLTLYFVFFYLFVNTNMTCIDIRALSQLKICSWHKQVKPNNSLHIPFP